MVYEILTEFPQILMRNRPASGLQAVATFILSRARARHMIQRLSVNLLLKSVILTLSAAIVIVLSLGAWNSWQRQATVKRIAGVVETSANFFTALHNLRVDRATTFRELSADRVNAQLPPQLQEVRQIEIPALKAGLAALETV